MNVTAQVKSQVEAKMRKCHAMAEAHYNRTFDFPSIAYTVRGTVGGWARGTKEVNFNPVLLMENLDHFLESTVPHELAHCLDAAVNPHNHTRSWGRKRSVHGDAWKRVMIVIGVKDPSRCHSYDVTNSRVGGRRQAKHVWKCNNCQADMKLGPGRHKKQLLSNTAYRPVGKGCRRTHTYSYFGLEGATIAPMPTPKAPEPKKPVSHKRPKAAGSKKAQAEALYRQHAPQSRKFFIALFIKELDMKAAGASTYYYNCTK